jgi:hypothetical protein
LNFDHFIEVYPDKEPTGTLSMQDAKLIEEISPALCDFLQSEGIAFYDSGFLSTVNPSHWKELKDMIALPGAQATILLRTAFGDFYLWMNNAVYLYQTSYNKYLKITEDINYLFNVFLIQKDFADTFLFRNIHTETRKLHGKLAYDEVYAFVPALPLGGDENIQNIAIVKLTVYISILLQSFNNRL